MERLKTKPSDIKINTTPPLAGVFGRVEREVAAALLVLACQDAGSWFPRTPHEIGIAVKAHEGERGFEWFANSFIKPDFWDLHDHGYIEGDIENGGALSFTERGLSALQASRWCRVEVRTAPPKPPS